MPVCARQGCKGVGRVGGACRKGASTESQNVMAAADSTETSMSREISRWPSRLQCVMCAVLWCAGSTPFWSADKRWQDLKVLCVGTLVD